jgi:hypothetical protein
MHKNLLLLAKNASMQYYVFSSRHLKLLGNLNATCSRAIISNNGEDFFPNLDLNIEKVPYFRASVFLLYLSVGSNSNFGNLNTQSVYTIQIYSEYEANILEGKKNN